MRRCFQYNRVYQSCPRSEFIMSCYLFLSLVLIAVCEAGIITSGDHSHHAVYHGYGATSYQNVQLGNHDAIEVPVNYGDPAEIQEIDVEHDHERIIPIVESDNDVDHIVSHSVPYEEFGIDDVKSDILDHYLDHDHYETSL
ncbi:hypothetical protein ALC62_07091 [Cyphomyrmex costatus]|uniref:Uncharacterized protein n=1 Tax=Cyphomyrmex costatus TaxID=456900 RepID=A0A195CMY1_9HYME|nr:hypothetical protein ALC62_07091 [Cyphomyrmex costatus]